MSIAADVFVGLSVSTSIVVEAISAELVWWGCATAVLEVAAAAAS